MIECKSRVVTLVVAGGLILAGCATGSHSNVPNNPASFGAPDATGLTNVSDSYRLGALDTITINVFQIPDLSGDYQIDPAGNLNLPLIGSLPAQGKSVPELQTELRTRFSAKYLQDPDVRVEIKQSLGQRVTVDGAVTAPGIYPVTGDTSLIQVIALAKGAAQDSNISRVVIFRKINGRREAAGFDIKKIRKGEMPDPPVYGNDIVVVDGTHIRRTFHDIISSIPLLALFGPL